MDLIKSLLKNMKKSWIFMDFWWTKPEISEGISFYASLFEIFASDKSFVSITKPLTNNEINVWAFPDRRAKFFKKPIIFSKPSKYLRNYRTSAGKFVLFSFIFGIENFIFFTSELWRNNLSVNFLNHFAVVFWSVNRNVVYI